MGRSPNLIITDQDPAMKVAVARVLPDSKHRLCMWHIMMKVFEKTPAHLKKDESFRKHLNDVVWSDLIVTSMFEQTWNEIMVDFGLVDESWFCGLYDIRQFWIPAYFRDLPMSGVCRTTSISESVNSFFNHFLSHTSNLVEFLMHFESALDAQRHSNDLLNNADSSGATVLKTLLQIEKHAFSVYTSKMFIKVQEEIVISRYGCSIVNVHYTNRVVTYEVEDGSDVLKVEAAKRFLGVLRSYLEFLCSNLRSHTITNVQSNDDKVSLLLKESFIELESTFHEALLYKYRFCTLSSRRNSVSNAAYRRRTDGLQQDSWIASSIPSIYPIKYKLCLQYKKMVTCLTHLLPLLQLGDGLGSRNMICICDFYSL